MSNIVDYYSYLFTFPSRWVMVASILATMGVVGVLSFGLTFGVPGLLRGLIFGLGGLAIPVIVSDFITGAVQGGDALLKPRRINIISFVWGLAGGLILVLSGILAALTANPVFLFRGALLAVFSSAGLRLLIFSIFSTRGFPKMTFAVMVQPALLFIATGLLAPDAWQISTPTILLILALILSGPILLVVRLSRWNFGDGATKIIPIFRAFVYAWTEEFNGPLEEQLAAVSEPRSVEADSLQFDAASGACLGRLVAPYVHPGPFRKVGSSGLSLSLTEGLTGCETLVAHGVSNHEWDLAKSGDVARIVDALRGASASASSETCGPMVRAEVGGAKASCQIFGEIALFTLTLSPKSHDDIPDTVKDRVRAASKERGLIAVVVDAHNCLDDEDLLDDGDVENLATAAVEALDRAAKLKQAPFKAGFSRVRPSEWGLDDGMGPCGIGAAVVEAASGERYAYVVFDSNNMIQGLRERLVDKLEADGYAGAEMLTSDTHLVNAIGATERGYHPMGEAMEEEKVLKYIDEALKEAKTSPSIVSFTRIRVDDVQVIGVKGIEALRGVVKTSFRLFIRTAAAALPLTFIAATIVALLA